jgi:carbamoyl-phosphate synthase small subunit
MANQKSAILLLEDGRSFTGRAFGFVGETTGEVCFNTGMTGYQEILTDPSYCKQIVTMTAPHIGNYGVNTDDVESDRIQVSGFVIKEETEIPSNWRSNQSIGQYLNDQKIVGIQQVDTRAIHSPMITDVTRNGPCIYLLDPHNFLIIQILTNGLV